MTPPSNSVPVHGYDDSESPKSLRVDGDGNLQIAGSGEGGALVVQGATGMTPILAGGITKRVSVEFTRPADTSTYADNDAVTTSTSAGTIITFPDVARVEGGTGIILGARLVADSATVSNALFRLWLFNDEVTPTNDNASFSLTYANSGKRLAYIDFALQTAGGSSDCAESVVDVINRAFSTIPSGKNLYGILTAKGAYVPKSGGKFTVELSALND